MLDKQQQEQLLDLFTDTTTIAKKVGAHRDAVNLKIKAQLIENKDYFYKGIQIIVYKSAVKYIYPEIKDLEEPEDFPRGLDIQTEILSLEEVAKVFNKPLNTVKTSRKKFVNKTIAGMCLTTLSGVLKAYKPKATSYTVKLISPLLKKHSTEQFPEVYAYITNMQLLITDDLSDIPPDADTLFIGGVLPTQGNYKERMSELNGIINNWIDESIQIYYATFKGL